MYLEICLRDHLIGPGGVVDELYRDEVKPYLSLCYEIARNSEHKILSGSKENGCLCTNKGLILWCMLHVAGSMQLRLNTLW